MKKRLPSDLLYHWYSALAEPIGLLLRTNDPIRFRNQLYAARRAAGDPSLAPLQIRLLPGLGLAITNPQGGAAKCPGT